MLSLLFLSMALATRVLLEHRSRTTAARQAAEAQVRRQRLSIMLGSIGAPLLETHDESSPVTTQQAAKLEEMMEAYVDWIQTVDEILVHLRRATGFQLGLGFQSKAILRVERATLGRVAKIGGSPRSMSLATVRERLFRAIQMHNHMLLSIMEQDYNDRRGELCGSEIVLSLSTLQLTRKESVYLLSEVIDYLLLSTFSEDLIGQVDALTRLSKECLSYFQPWLAYGKLKDHVTSLDSNDVRKMQCGLEHLHSQVDGLRSALFACQETLYREKTANSLGCQASWEEAKLILGNLSKETVVIEQLLGFAEGSSEAEGQDSSDPPVHSTRLSQLPEAGEYAADGATKMELTEKKRDDLQARSRILVYAGEGSVHPKHRDATKGQPSNDPEAIVPTISVATEYQLLQELQRRLRTLPSMEEFVVTSSACEPDASDVNAKTTVIEETEPSVTELKDDSAIDTFILPSRKTGTVSFLAELTKALPTEKKEDVAEEHFSAY